MTPVLVVDDEAHICLLLKQMLEPRGFSCTLASTVEEARVELAEQNFDLIILDIRMPDESGLELLKHVRENRPDTAVVMCSVVDDPEVAKTALNCGAYGYIIKPFESNEVMINVVNALRRRQLELENRLHRQNLEAIIDERTADLRRAIAELEAAQGELLISEERYRTLVETMREALGENDENGVLTYVNPRFCEMLGYPYDEMLGRRVTDFLDEAGRRTFEAELARRKRGESGSYELVFERKDGRKIHTIVAPQAILDDQDRFKGSFAVITEITELKQVEEELRRQEAELRLKTEELEEMNTALKVLLDQRDKDKQALQERVVSNVARLVLPYVQELEAEAQSTRQRRLLEIVGANLNEIVSPLTHQLSLKYQQLTTKEVRVASLIKDGRTNKEIAELMNVSTKTVEYYRDNIRSKLGLKNRSVNLRTFLNSIS